MKYCEKCGRKVDTDADTCPYCGAPLREMQDGELSEEELLLLLGLLLGGLRDEKHRQVPQVRQCKHHPRTVQYAPLWEREQYL